MSTASRLGAPLGFALTMGMAAAMGCAGSLSADATAGDANDTTMTDSTDGADRATPVDDFCAVNFPCAPGETIRCVGSTQYQAVVSHDCSYACHSTNCTGGTCDPVGPIVSCPAGWICMHAVGGADRCVEPDGGDTDAGAIDAATDGSAE